MKALDPRLIKHASTARWYIAALVASGAISGALLIAQAWLLARGIADLDIGVCAPLAGVVAARAGLSWLTEWLAARSAITVKSTLRRSVVAHALRLGPRYLSGARTGETTALLTGGLDGLDSYVARYLPQLMVSLIVPVLVLVAIIRVDLVSAIVIVVTLPLIPVFMALVGAGAQSAARKRFRALATLSHHFMDVVSGLTTLKVFGRANAQPDRVKEVSDEYRQATMGTLRLAFLSSLVLDLLSMIAVALVAVGVGLRLAGGEMGFASALFVLILVPEAFIPMRALGANFHASADGLAAMDAVERVLSEPISVAVATATTAAGALVIRDLGVRHPGRPEPAPAAFSMRVEPGEFVAVTGPSGVGKSTLVAVLLGFVTPDEGEVSVGGVDQRQVEVAHWRQQFSWLPQDPYLMRGTVASNIALGRASATSAEIAAAAREAALDVPLDRPVDDGGIGLSAGQRRRVGLARALLRDAPYLVLDEPTAGLDADTESRVLAALRRSGRTVIAIAHRPAAVAAADRVIEMASAERAVPTTVGVPA